MSIGFVMLAHEALHRAAQVARLLSQSGCPLVIHVDRRVTDKSYDVFVESLKQKRPCVCHVAINVNFSTETNN